MKSLYADMKDSNHRSLELKIDANIDPCHSCIVKDEKAPIHCSDCPVNPDKRKKGF